MAAGFLGMGLAAWLMSRWTLDVGPWDVAWIGCLQGFASSFAFVPLASRAFVYVEPRYRADAMPMFYLALNIGGSLGIASVITYWSESTQSNHALLAEHVNAFNPLFRSGALPGFWSLERGTSVAALDSEIVRQASMIAYDNSFTLIAIVACVVAPIAFLMRRRAAHPPA